MENAIWTRFSFYLFIGLQQIWKDFRSNSHCHRHIRYNSKNNIHYHRDFLSFVNNFNNETEFDTFCLHFVANFSNNLRLLIWRKEKSFIFYRINAVAQLNWMPKINCLIRVCSLSAYIVLLLKLCRSGWRLWLRLWDHRPNEKNHFDG